MEYIDIEHAIAAVIMTVLFASLSVVTGVFEFTIKALFLGMIYTSEYMTHLIGGLL